MQIEQEHGLQIIGSGSQLTSAACPRAKRATQDIISLADLGDEEYEHVAGFNASPLQLFQDPTLVGWFSSYDTKKIRAHWLSVAIQPPEFHLPEDRRPPDPGGVEPLLLRPVS
eukprot:5531791-Pyramimonas_sp.AAC.1